MTVCSYRRRPFFGQIIEREVIHTKLGALVDKCWQQIPQHFNHVAIDTFIVMPNHLHGILNLIEPRRGTIYRAPTEGFGKPTRGSVPSIIRAFKAAVTREWRDVTKEESAIVWQRNYYEHTIRGEDELNRLRRYIVENPLRWAHDRYHHP